MAVVVEKRLTCRKGHVRGKDSLILSSLGHAMINMGNKRFSET